MSFQDDDPLADWIPLASSNLDAYRYDKRSRELVIRFHGSRNYKYFNIPQEMVDGLARASSPGQWWHANLKGAPFEKE